MLLRSNDAIARALEGVPSPWWFLTYTFNFQIGLANAWPDSFLLNHFWSLCVEEQFYFLWPLLVYWVHRRWWLHLVACMFVIALAVEVWLLMHDAHWSVIHSSLFTRLDSLGIGALGAFLHRGPYRLKVVPLFLGMFWLAATVLLLCAVMKKGSWPTGWHSYLIMQPALTLWSATLVYLLVNPPSRGVLGAARVLRLRPCTMLGKYSYCIYLFHWSIYMCTVEIDAFDWKTASLRGNFGMVAVITLVLAFLSYQVLEKRCLRLKSRAFKPLASASDTISTRSPPVAPPAALSGPASPTAPVPGSGTGEPSAYHPR